MKISSRQKCLSRNHLLTKTNTFLSTDMLAKQGFDWKKIEDKPDNWETIRNLIKDAYTPRSIIKDKYWDNATVLDIFLDIFPQMKEWMAAHPLTKKQDKKQIKKATLIIERQTMDIIRNDLLKIRFDANTQMVILTSYHMDITYVLMILVWNFTFYFRSLHKKAINKVAQLDAIISLNRIYEEENVYFTERLRNAVTKAIGIMNTYINDGMYDCLFDHPYLLLQSTADKRPKNTVLYQEQHQSMDMIVGAVRTNTPLLLGNQMPTGTGKTFLSIPLAQKIYHQKLRKTVLFACSNELVNQDVASTALLADDLHLWLARLIRDEKGIVNVLLRPYKRCFPATWKKVYKKEDKKKDGTIKDQWEFYTKATGRQPDIIVADLEACREILMAAPSIGDPFIAYIDEFISDEYSNRVMKMIGKILPRYSVIISAILPQFSDLNHMVDHFCQRHGTTPEVAVQRVATAVVNISCAIIDHEGRLTMPHHTVHSPEDLRLLLQDIQVNPRIRRAYTAKHVYHWCRSLEQHLQPVGLDFQTIFPNIGFIRSTSILDHAITMLRFLSRRFDLLDDFQKYRPIIMQPPSFSTMFTTQAHFYDGKTLVVSNDIYTKVMEHTRTLMTPSIEWRTIVANYIARLKEKEKMYEATTKLTLSKSKENGKSERLDSTDIAMKISSIVDTDVSLKIPPEYVINSREHYAKFVDPTILFPNPRYAIDIPIQYDDAFEPDLNMLLSAGIGIYDITKMTGYQRRLVMDLYAHFLFLCSGKEIVFGTNLPSLTNIFIDASFGETEHPNNIYQLMGRAGRMGRSYHANIIVNSPITLHKILNYRGDETDPTIIDFNQSFL